jgi:hypothetical protein
VSTSATHHLAQLNVGRIRGPIDGPVMAAFVAGLDRINALADAAPGFLWRLQTEDGNATAVRPFEDERMLVNLSVWASAEALADFVYRSDHTAFLRRRREWFEPLADAVTVLWWIPAGTTPTVAEAIERLEHLRAHGPAGRAFTFRRRFDPDGQPVPADERDRCGA